MSTELTTLNANQLIPTVRGKTLEQVAQVVHNNLAGGNIRAADLTKITVPTGGALYWTVNTEPVKELVAVIVGNKPGRRYYQNPVQPGQPATPPDCLSTDLLTGIGEPGGSCLKCPYNQWGSARPINGQKQRGKACGEYRHLFLRIPGDDSIFPTILQVPATSLGVLSTYLGKTLGGRGFAFWDVVTRFTLVEGSPAASIKFEAIADLSEEVAAQMAAYAQAMARLIADLAIAALVSTDEGAVEGDENGDTIPF